MRENGGTADTSEPVVWYRVEERRVAAPLNDFDEPVGRGHTEVEMYDFPVLRETPKGVWLHAWAGRRFVRRDARKRWACPTKAEALASFRARKARQLGILREQVDHIETALHLATLRFRSPHPERESESV